MASVVLLQWTPAAAVLSVGHIGDAEQSGDKCRTQSGCFFKLQKCLVHRTFDMCNEYITMGFYD